MWVMKGQMNHINKVFPEVIKDNCKIISEFGNDRGTHFVGKFLVKIKGKGFFLFEDGNMIKCIK